jgi:chitin disaccharide deacetylase
MLTINADDLGRCATATDRIMACFAANRISAASAMVFMQDSERAAALAKASGLDVGLHINFTENFTGPDIPQQLRREHERICKFLRRSKYALLLYNPFLRRAFREVFQAQAKEFQRLYGQPPLRIDGHQHMHLCTNMLLEGILPAGTKVRRNFSFSPGEKSFVNRYYRNIADHRLRRRHQLTDYFFALSQHLQPSRLRRVILAAKTAKVELMTHPQVDDEYTFLLGDDFADAISEVQLRSFESQNDAPHAELLS